MIRRGENDRGGTPMIDFMKLQHGSEIRGMAADDPQIAAENEAVALTEEAAGAIAGAFAYWLGFKVGKNPYDLRICVGNDARLSADTLKSGILKGISMFGAEGYDAGLAPAPAMFMSTVLPQLDFDGAVMITASHLPCDRNGFKFFTKEGELNKEDITSILKTASRYNFVGEFYEERDINLLPVYSAYLRQMLSLGLRDVPGGLSGVHVVVDAGNGTGGFFATQVLEPLGADISGSQFLEPDGRFPNHEPDPGSKSALGSICRAVKENGADLGLIFDGDADSVAVIGPDGEPVSGNAFVALAAAIAAEDYPGGTVVTDSATSAGLHDFLEKELGLKHLRYRSGCRNMISKAKEINTQAGDPVSDGAGRDLSNAFLAAGTSGHAAYSDNYYMDDGMFLAVQIVINAARLKKEGKDITALISGLSSPAESTGTIIKVKNDKSMDIRNRILGDLEKWVRETSGFELDIPNYEGVRANFRLPSDAAAGEAEAEGWFLLRKAFHETALILNIEADKEGASGKVLRLIEEFLSKYEETEFPQ